MKRKEKRKKIKSKIGNTRSGVGRNFFRSIERTRLGDFTSNRGGICIEAVKLCNGINYQRLIERASLNLMNGCLFRESVRAGKPKVKYRDNR